MFISYFERSVIHDKYDERKKQFNLRKVILLFLAFTFLFSTCVFAASDIIDESNGNVRVKMRHDYHPIPSVTKYLNAKYGTLHNPSTRNLQHTNVELYYENEEVRNYHVVTYVCPECKKPGTLIYSYEDGITDLHNCDDDKDKTREDLASEAMDEVKVQCNNALKDLGASLLDLAALALIFLLIIAAAIAMIAACAVVILI